MPQRQPGETREMLRGLTGAALIRSPQWGCLGVLLVFGVLYALRAFFFPALLALTALVLLAVSGEKQRAQKWGLRGGALVLALLAAVLLLPDLPAAR